ncbi:MAG: 50S ribosomal protein L6 [Bacillota bacterium]|nr:50S ribosomal protein L6 [Bacillota bacterium]MDW7729442.1 50S ribosomal protein L6 [Bacillota bacterium]
MSRTGKKPVVVPENVEVQLDGSYITVKGPKGELSQELPGEMIIEREEDKILVKRPTDSPQHRALHGLTRTLIDNMVVGVTEGYSRNLELVGVGYKAALQGKKLVLNIGFSHPVEFDPDENMEIEVPSPTKITVRGIDKQKVGNLAAVIRRTYPPEPYKGKGIRYENETVRQKVGKAGK